MAISIDWATKVITIHQVDLTNITGTLYELNTDQFRKDLKNLEDDEVGMPFLDTHRHNTEVTIVGVTYARVIEIINGYSITFEDGQYSVRLAGSNNNFFDVENGILNQNQVQVIAGNSAGLIVVTQSSGVTDQDKLDIADRVWDEATIDHIDVGSYGKWASTVSDNVVRTLGLAQENYYLDNMVYTTWSGIKLLTDGRLRTYSVAGSVGTGSDVTATYQITSTWVNDELNTYKVVKN